MSAVHETEYFMAYADGNRVVVRTNHQSASEFWSMSGSTALELADLLVLAGQDAKWHERHGYEECRPTEQE